MNLNLWDYIISTSHRISEEHRRTLIIDIVSYVLRTFSEKKSFDKEDLDNAVGLLRVLMHDSLANLAVWQAHLDHFDMDKDLTIILSNTAAALTTDTKLEWILGLSLLCKQSLDLIATKLNKESYDDFLNFVTVTLARYE